MAAASKKQPTPPEIRAARSFLVSKGVPMSAVPPRLFAATAKELGKGFRETLRFIARLYSGGQDQSGFRREVIIGELDH